MADLVGLGVDAAESAVLDVLCDSVDRFARERVHAQEIDRAGHVDRDVLSGLADLGVFGLSLPTEHGGFGISLRGACSAVATLARHDRSVATTVGLHLGLGTRGLVAYGSDELKRSLLPDLASGRRIAAFATTEPGAGSDLAAIRTRAEQRGDRLRVDGSKIFVTNGGIADVLTVTAFSPGLGGARRGHSLVALLRDDPGVTIGPEEIKLGLRGSSTTSLHLDGVDVPMDRIVGGPGDGMQLLHAVLAWGRTLMAAGCVGTADAAIEATTAHVSRRKQFGRALIAFDIVREQIAGMMALRYAMESLVRATAALEADSEALRTRSLAAKVLCSEGAWEIADGAVQLHGGGGFIEETGVALLLRDARITRIFEGANDVLRVRLGLAAAGDPYARVPLVEQVPAALAGLALGADVLATDVRELCFDLASAYGIRLAQEPRHLRRLGSLVALREATDAAVLRAAQEGTSQAADLAAHWLVLAERRAAPSFRAPAPLDPIVRITEATAEGATAANRRVVA